jgi:hypothetical protein
VSTHAFFVVSHPLVQIVGSMSAHHMHIVEWAQGELDDVSRFGLRVFQSPCGLAGTAESLKRTASLFSGSQMMVCSSSSNVSRCDSIVQEHNVAFVHERLGWDMAAQPFGRQVCYVSLVVRGASF